MLALLRMIPSRLFVEIMNFKSSYYAILNPVHGDANAKHSRHFNGLNWKGFKKIEPFDV